MTYKSPITLIKTQADNFIKEVNEKTDEVIFKAVVNVLPQVNKDELLKALAYDRGQYSKGYRDRDSEIVRCKDCKYKCLYDDGDTKYYYCALEDRPNRNWSIDDTDYCSWGEESEVE